jgi:hypothetical protein
MGSSGGEYSSLRFERPPKEMSVKGLHLKQALAKGSAACLV